MNCYKEDYGSDADGNRGINTINCDIEESDRYEIRKQILLEYKDSRRLSDTSIVWLYCHICEDEVPISVNVDKYLKSLLKYKN